MRSGSPPMQGERGEGLLFILNYNGYNSTSARQRSQSDSGR